MARGTSVRSTVLAGVGAAVGFIFLVSMIAIISVNRLVGAYGSVVDVTMPALKAVNDARSAERDVVIAVLPIVGPEGVVEDLDKLKSAFEKSVDAYESSTKALLSITPLEGESSLRDAVGKAWRSVTDHSRKLLELGASDKSDDVGKRKKLGKSEFADARKQFNDSFVALESFHNQNAKKTALKASDLSSMSRWMMIIANLFCCTVVFLLGIQVANSLTRRLSELTRRISETSSATMSASQEISSAIDSLASSSTQQASSLQETASHMEEISAMIQKNADNAQKSQSISQDSQHRANEGKETVQQMVTAIEVISKGNQALGERIEQSNREMTEIVKVIREIETKTKVINDIVFQTKLLSFNASVEAARAGEQGKGFAVVAEEVGNLAQMSGDAAQSISKILREGTHKVESIIEMSSSQISGLIQDNRDKVKVGIETAERCEKVLESLVENVTQMSSMAASIATASQEQSQGVREVNASVGQLDNVLQRSNQTSQSLSSASQSLLGQTDGLTSVVQELAVVVNGTDSRAA